MLIVAPPANVMPGTPKSSIVPEAYIAYLPAPRSRIPASAFASWTPTAAGLGEPSGSKAGPRPRKMLMPVPAKLPAEKVICRPSMVTKSPIVSVRFAPKNSNTLLPSANAISKSCPLTERFSSTGSPVLFTRNPKLPPTATPPTLMEARPDSTPAMPPEPGTPTSAGRITNAPAPSVIPCP